MRTLSANLTTAQQSGNVVPYMRLVLTDGVDTYTFDNHGYDSATKRIADIVALEEPFGGRVVVTCSNSDKWFATKDLRGFGATLSWGAKVNGTYEYSAQAPLFVYDQKDTSINEESAGRGGLTTDLILLDYWWLIAFTTVIRAGVRLSGTVVEGLELGETVTGSNSNATGVVVDITTGSITVTSVSGTFETEENAEGSTGSVDDITAVDTIVGGSGVDYGRSDTILNILKAIMPTKISDVTLDSDDGDDTINTYSPLLVTEPGTSARLLTRQLLQMSKCVGRIENDSELHVLYPDPNAAAEYTYQTTHAFWFQIRERARIMPNSVLFVNHMPGSLPEGTDQYQGSATDADSVTDLGELPHIEVDPTIESDAEAVTRAEAWIAQRVTEANQGAVKAPMNCGQELYDQVSIVDSRSGLTVTGRVGRIVRTYHAVRSTLTDPIDHEYSIEVTLGGIISSPGSVGGPGTLDMDLRDLSIDVLDMLNKREIPYIDWSTILPTAIQGYHHNITFSATDYDTVAWSSGTINFYDGTTQSIDAGNTGNLPDTNIRYIYFDLDSDTPATLLVTDNYLSVMDRYTGLVCLAQKASDSNMKATFIPSYGKEPLITPDVIDMTGLKFYDYGGGTYIQALLSTQIQAGTIKISSATTFDTDYDPTEKFDLGDDSLDDVADGATYGRVAITDISAGHIILSEVVGDLDDIAEGSTYGKVKQTILDAGFIQVGTGTKDDTLSGWYIDNTEIVGQSSGVDQVVLSATDGKLYAVGGDFVMDADGLRLQNDKTIGFYDDQGTPDLKGIIYGHQTAGFVIGADTGIQLYLSGTPVKVNGDLVPNTDSTYDLGSSSLAWAEGYIDKVLVTANGRLRIPVGTDLYD